MTVASFLCINSRIKRNSRNIRTPLSLFLLRFFSLQYHSFSPLIIGIHKHHNVGNSCEVGALACLVFLAVIIVFNWIIFHTNPLDASAQEIPHQVFDCAFFEYYSELFIENSHPHSQIELPVKLLVAIWITLMPIGHLESLERIQISRMSWIFGR